MPDNASVAPPGTPWSCASLLSRDMRRPISSRACSLQPIASMRRDASLTCPGSGSPRPFSRRCRNIDLHESGDPLGPQFVSIFVLKQSTVSSSCALVRAIAFDTLPHSLHHVGDAKRSPSRTVTDPSLASALFEVEDSVDLEPKTVHMRTEETVKTAAQDTRRDTWA